MVSQLAMRIGHELQTPWLVFTFEGEPFPTALAALTDLGHVLVAHLLQETAPEPCCVDALAAGHAFCPGCGSKTRRHEVWLEDIEGFLIHLCTSVMGEGEIGRLETDLRAVGWTLRSPPKDPFVLGSCAEQIVAVLGIDQPLEEWLARAGGLRGKD